MQIEQFTEKAREAISAAAELARQHNHSRIEVEHLLAALLDQEGGVVQQIIAGIGGDLLAAQRMVKGDLEGMAQVYGGSERGISPRLRTVLGEGSTGDECLSLSPNYRFLHGKIRCKSPNSCQR
jgi:ATP-dependent Clp protease ATP-binding subunit ClpB